MAGQHVPEEFLGQILRDGKWLDYARGHEASARTWYEADPANRRVVDWIYKERILMPAPTTCRHCQRAIVNDPRQGWIDAEQLQRLATPLAKNGYGQYLMGLLK